MVLLYVNLLPFRHCHCRISSCCAMPQMLKKYEQDFKELESGEGTFPDKLPFLASGASHIGHAKSKRPLKWKANRVQKDSRKEGREGHSPIRKTSLLHPINSAPLPCPPSSEKLCIVVGQSNICLLARPSDPYS